MTTQEEISITNFKISIGNGQYWIEYGDSMYPILIAPYFLVKLFEIEGIELTATQFDDENSIEFKKAILKRTTFHMYGVLMGEEGESLMPYECWV